MSATIPIDALELKRLRIENGLFAYALRHRLSANQVQDIAARLMDHPGLRLQSDGQFHQNGVTIDDAVIELRSRDGVDHLFAASEGTDAKPEATTGKKASSALERLKAANRTRGQ